VLRAQWDAPGHTRRWALVSAFIKEVIVWPAHDTGPTALAGRVQIWWRGQERPGTPSRSKRQGIRERRAAGAYDGCSVEGCPEPYRSNGLCNVHLERVKEHGKPGGAERLRHPWYRGALCVDAGCEAPAESVGRCDFHYRLWKRTDLTRPLCIYEGCERTAQVRQWCQRHYVYLWRRGALTSARSQPQRREQ
jgi:hypothetical protein